MTDHTISPQARLGHHVQFGYGVRVLGTAEIGDDSVIGDYSIIGHAAGGPWAGQPVRIGPGATIRSHTILYEGSSFGPRLETGHHCLIREGTRAGENLRVGSFSDIEGDCQVGDFCRFHSYVHVGRGSKIGNFVWLYSLTTLTNDPLPPSDVFAPVVLEDGVVLCVSVIVMPGAALRCGSLAAAKSVVGGEVPAGAVVSGPEGRIVSHVSLLTNMAHGVRHPWMFHYGHHYPETAQARLRQLGETIQEGREAFIAQYLQGV